jgi:exodeoxyribonuclease V gamma subunit
MPNLKLYTSNRLENLAEALAKSVRRPLGFPLEPETILVQSQGMARWLKLQLAQHHGICSNCQFPFPQAFTYEQFHLVLPGLPEQAVYEPELLVWRIMKQLPQLLDQPGFEGLKNYLAGEPDSRKLYQLADRIGYLFDQYLVFRPELVLQWEKGASEDWQPRLWREISGPFKEQHPAALQARVVQHLESATGPVPELSERISIFGISALPPYYLRIFAVLARHIEVDLFLLQPCEQFWGYISSVREQEKTLRRAGKGAAEAGQLHLEKGNRLLASMGQLGRDFLLLIQEMAECQEPEPSLFNDPGEASVLACIQSDILNLGDRGTGESQKKVAAEKDDSVQVHCCHSPLRELEVLYDHLLDWFEKDIELAPRDILVMIPDIEQYAPFIHAVFGSPEQEALRIPFSVADRAARTQSQLIETFLSLLNLAGSRLGVSRVLTILESAPVRKRFELAEDDLELARHWVEEVRIRWGQDEQQRSTMGLPAWSENTWRHGLERLLLGYAMAGNGEKLFKGILPFDDIEGGAANVLGKLAGFVEQLFAVLKLIESPRRLDEWAGTFQGILRDFFETGDDEASELLVLRACFEKLSHACERAQFDQPVELAVVLEQLNRDLSGDPFGAGYLTGGITFCALKPMRSIPAKVICLLGMNDRSFPRTSAQLSFDLMAQEHQLGDRSSREDDRYLFLETLISARQRLYISYVAQSIKDNSEAPPSVLVSELLDYISQGFELPGQDIIKDHTVTKHRLQAFSRAYFGGGRLFSYSRENLQASRVISPERKAPGAFVSEPLAEPKPEWRRLTSRTLADFFCHPARFLAAKRLGIRLPSETTGLEEREPFGVEGLERYKLQEELLELKLGGSSITNSQEWVRASGRLPAGITGNACYAQVRRDVEVFYKRLQPFKPESFQLPSSREVAIGDFIVTVNFSRVTPDGLLFYRPATIKPKDLLRAWVEHLLWQAANPAAEPTATVVVGTESFWKIAPTAEPLHILEQLLKLYWAGLREPLKFFPESSYAFAAADFKMRHGTSGRTVRQPMDFAQEKWNGNDFGVTGECEDGYVALFFRNSDSLDDEFERYARTVFDPLLEVAEEIKE